MDNKGYAIIMDALIALFLFLIIITIMMGIEYFKTPKSTILDYRKLNYWADDTLDVMNKKGILDEIAYNWALAKGNKSSPNWTKASNICDYYVNKLLPQQPRVGYKLTIKDPSMLKEEVICNSSWNKNRTLESDAETIGYASRLLVGFGENKTISGFVANALLSDITSKTTSAFAFFGGFVGNGNISRFIDLPDDAVVQDAYMELNAGGKFNLYINGVNCGVYTPSGGYMEANIKTSNFGACSFHPGRNTIDIEFTEGNITKSFIGGGFIQVRYKTSKFSEPYKSKFYFPGIKGFINLYSSFYVPSKARPKITGHLHYNKPAGEGKRLLFRIGNETIYNSTASGNINVILNDNNFSAIPTSELVRNTVPIRLFVEGGNGTADVVLTTDLSTSMKKCMSGFRFEPSWNIGECGGFWADFDYGEDDRWEINSGEWIIDSDTYYQTLTEESMTTIDVFPLSRSYAGDFIARFKMRITYSSNSNSWAGMVIRKQNKDHWHDTSGYLILYRYNGELGLYKGDSGTLNTLRTIGLPVTPEDWRTIEICAEDNNIRVSVDGVLYINYTDTTSPYLYGYFSLVTDDARVRFDDIYIEPTGVSSSKCPPLGVCYYSNRPGFLYKNIGLDNLKTCGGWEVVPNCVGGTSFCYCNPCDDSTRYRIAECGGQTVGGSYDACCNTTCCPDPPGCCERDSWGEYSDLFGNCSPSTWAENNLTHCRAVCNHWTNWELGNCSTNNFTSTWCIYGPRRWVTCDESIDPPGPSTLDTFCYEEIRANFDSDMTITAFTANCTDLPEPLPSSTYYETEKKVCDGNCSNPEYLYCTAQYIKIQTVSNCSSSSAEYCQCFTEGTSEVCYEFDRTLRGYRRYWRDCLSYFGRGWWATYTNASEVCYDCVNITYSCRNDYSSIGMDDSSWDNVSTPDTGWWGCDRCSRFYRKTFNIPDVSSITWLNLSVGSDDGAICYINDKVVHYDPTGHSWRHWNWVLPINSSILVNGQNIIACQVKENGGAQGFDLKLEANTGVIIDSRDTWLYHHQEEFCGSNSHHYGGARDFSFDPESSSCEYGEWVDDCGDIYPANQPPKNVSAWTRWTYNYAYENRLKPVGEHLARFLNGKYIEDESGYGHPIPHSFWNSADVLIVDGHWAPNYYKTEIKNALNNGKIVITNYYNFWDIWNDPDIGEPPYNIADSYDLRCFYFNYGSGILIGDQYDALANYWKPSYVRDKRDKAANILNAIYPVWYKGTDPNHACPSEYCIPGKKGCKICNVTRIKLAKSLDKFFVNDIIANTNDVNVGLVGYGSSVCGDVNLTRDITLLNATIDDYKPTCGFTCISCAIERGIKILNGSNAKNKYLIIMSDGEANTCINSTPHTCDNSPYGAPNAINETITLACKAWEKYNISVYAIGFGIEAGTDTLNKTAICGHGKFYQSSDPEGLAEIYKKIAKDIVKISQTVETDITNTTLYNDSYLEFDYDPYIPLGYGEVAITYTSDRFNNTEGCNGTVYIPADISKIIDFKVTSYSAEHWTDFVDVLIPPALNPSFDLSTYSDIYFNIGDPYTVYIQPDLFNKGQNNTVKILTGDNPTEKTGCSPDNRAIITVGIRAFSSTEERVFSSSGGCNWTIEFSNGTGNSYFVNVTIPYNYTGSKKCNYTNASITIDEEDAINYVVYKLLDQLDIDDDGRVDILFNFDDVEIKTIPTANVRSLWGPVEIKLITWL